MKNIFKVLNLIINGIPSIPQIVSTVKKASTFGFKPYYKWNTFNTTRTQMFLT